MVTTFGLVAMPVSGRLIDIALVNVDPPINPKLPFTQKMVWYWFSCKMPEDAVEQKCKQNLKQLTIPHRQLP